MMKKLYILLGKYKIALISAFIILLIGIFILFRFSFFNNKIFVEYIDDELYSFQYDTTWNLKEKKDDKIVLSHDSGSKITIQISKLLDEYKYYSVDEVIDEVIINIQGQNKNYNLISKKSDKITKYGFNGYKLLYENDTEQIMIDIYKKSDKLVIISYEATDDYFDILLDSVHNIIYSLDIKDKKFDLKNNIQLDISDIEYSSNEKLDSLLDNSSDYEIANSNYYVEYSIPSIFVRSTIDSSSGLFNYNFEDGTFANISVNILNYNIYEYLDKDKSFSVYNNYSFYRNGSKDDYSDFNESLSKLDDKYLGYIYKNSFLYNKALKYDVNNKMQEYKKPLENVELIYSLDKNHILIIRIDSNGFFLSKKIIDMINVNNIINYASFIKNEKEDNYLIGKLMRFSDFSKEKRDIIILKIPDEFEEVDKNQNFYLKRYYGLNYNEDMDIYDYDVHYELSELSDEAIIDIINPSYIKTRYGDSQQLIYSGNITINDKEFKVYDGGYTDISNIMVLHEERKKYYVNKKILFYKLSGKGNLYIEINGNGKDINDEIINKVVNFIVEEEV